MNLRLDEETTELAGTVMNIGFRRMARERFKHQPPTALELEAAIAAVEDEIARARPPRGARIVTGDAMVRKLADDIGVSPGAQMLLAREAVEQAFERSLRRPLPDNERMAALLILRELMHHLDLASIDVVTR
jgi:hypothetical protein